MSYLHLRREHQATKTIADAIAQAKMVMFAKHPRWRGQLVVDDLDGRPETTSISVSEMSLLVEKLVQATEADFRSFHLN